MSLCVGLGASQDDLDVQGEIDFDFFEQSDSSSKNPADLESKHDEKTSSDTSVTSSNNLLEEEHDCTEQDPNMTNVPESCSSSNFNKPIITVSCDDATGAVQKTNIETIIPTPFNYKDNKCGRRSPHASFKGKGILSPHLPNKIFKDNNDVSDDSSVSSMSESESDISASDDSFELNEGTDSMTDVTPLMSPFQCRTPNNEQNEVLPSQGMLKVAKKEAVKFAEGVGDEECGKCTPVDVMELLNAVKRLEMGQNINVMCQETRSSPSVITQNAKCRKNLSFSNEEVRRIDNENSLLLKKIMAQQNRSKHRPGSLRIISSSAVNRQRHQRQIELENLALLKRLESTKPSRDLSRMHLLRDYERRSSGVLSRASSRSCCSSSPGSSSCKSSAQSSGRSSAISIKSSTRSSLHPCCKKP